MQGCLAPSEVPGISSVESSIFGGVAEDLIYIEFSARARKSNELFRDDHNPAAYLYFLAVNNPSFTEDLQRDYYARLLSQSLMRVPDFLLHTAAEKAFYEVKPDSNSGARQGIDKVGTLSAVYPYYQLPYRAGLQYAPCEFVLAQYGTALRATLRTRLAGPGLIVYRLCLDAKGALEAATLAVILRYIIREANKQKGKDKFQPIDLSPVFRQNQQLEDLAKKLEVPLAAAAVTAAGTVAWKFFWEAVAKRFAVRIVLAESAAAVPTVGELVDAGLAIWIVIDIIRLSPELWQDAAELSRQEA